MTTQPQPDTAVTLASGAVLPRVGLGTWPMVGADAHAAVAYALSVGYRLIDTAEQYANEVPVGRAIRESGIPREDIFVTTKFNAQWHGFELAQRAYEGSLERLGLDYADLFLIHWPNPWLDRYVDAWRGLVALRGAGRVRAIGTSNFLPQHIDRLIAVTGEAPEVNQIEVDPTATQRDPRAYHAEHGIVTQAWGPLGRGGTLLHHPVVLELAERHRRTPAQVVLRWHIQHGLAFTARSSNPERIAQNVDLFDFALTPGELAAMDALDQGRAPSRDPEAHGH